MPLQPGQVLNQRYRIVKLLGQGGFGAVYRAWDLQMEGACAVKENLDTSPAAQRQFEREAKLLYKLRHTNLPRVFDHFVVADQGQYLVMDYIEGQDLDSKLLATQAPLPLAQVLDWIGQVCSALIYLHSQEPPIIHRDIKPANIRITPQNQAVLVDFGIAKSSDPGMQTSTGARALTPGFAPVEQYGSGKTDARSDIYALGATLYNILTGERPLESVQRTIKDNLTRPEMVNPKIPPQVSTIILQAMEIDPEKRFPSAAEFKRSLEAATQEEALVISPLKSFTSASAQPLSPTLQSSVVESQPGASTMRWGIIGIVIAALLLVGFLVVGVGGVFLYNRLTKPDAAQTRVSANATETLPGLRSTPESSNLESTAGLDLNALSTASNIESMATSTLFSPAEKPSDVPVMPGARELAVVQLNQQQGKPIIQLLFQSDAPEVEIISYYEREMPVNGWTKTSTYMDGNQRVVTFTKGNLIAVVQITQSSDPQMVAIMIMQQ